MKTPFDAALRLRQREIDELRVSIGVEVGQILVLEQRRDAIDAAIRAEREIASLNNGFSAEAFAARMYAQREAVCNDRDARDARLIGLRAEALAAYGALGAIAAAVDRHRDAILRAENIAEQSQVDDFSAARFTRAFSDARRVRSAWASVA